jgi:hypothetical protein
MAVYLPIISEFKDKGIKDASKGFKELEGAGEKMRFAFKKALVPALAVVGALAGAAGKMVLAGEKAATSNARIKNIAETMGLFGKETQNVTDRLIDLANKTARQTGLDQNAIKETQAKLLTFRQLAKSADEIGGAFDRATKAAIDMAAAGFGEATQNATQLGKALQDPIGQLGALRKAGIDFTEAEKDKIKVLVQSGNILEAQEMILKAIETQVGGTAEATANGSDKIKVAFSQMEESIALVILPAFEALVPLIEKFAAWAEKNPTVIVAVASAIGVLAAAIIAVNVALALNPIVLITAAIIGMAIAMTVYGPQIRSFFANLRKEVEDTLGPLALLTEVFFGLGDLLGGNIGGGGGGGIGGALKKALGMASLIKPGGRVLQKGIGMIPGLEDGGIVKARPGGTLALIGEGGRDEAVVPLGRSGSAFPTGGMTINVTGALDPVAVARQINDILASQQARYGY